MSRSLDMQVVFQRTPDISKIQQLKQNQGQDQNYHNSVITKQQFSEKEKSVNKTDLIDKKTVKDENSKKNSYFAEKDKNKEKDKDKESDKKNLTKHKILGNSIDLHI